MIPWNLAVTIAASIARNLSDAFLQPKIPLAACQLRLCRSNGSIGSISLVPPPLLQRPERINRLQDLDSGRVCITTSNYGLWPEGGPYHDILKPTT